MDLVLFKAQLTPEEGDRLRLYKDQFGNDTIGIGHNLTAKGISPAVDALMFQEDSDEVVVGLTAHFPWWSGLDDVRQRVVADLCFNMGLETLLTFTTFLGLMQSKNFSAAATDLASTEWAKQVGPRCPRLCAMLLTGKDPS